MVLNTPPALQFSQGIYIRNLKFKDFPLHFMQFKKLTYSFSEPEKEYLLLSR